MRSLVGGVGSLVFFGGGGAFLFYLGLQAWSALAQLTSSGGPLSIFDFFGQHLPMMIIGLVLIVVSLAALVTCLVFCTIVIWQWFLPDEVLTIWSQGFRDLRISKDILPWTALEVFDHPEFGHLIQLNPDVSRQYPLTLLARLIVIWPGGGRYSMGGGIGELNDPQGALRLMIETHAAAAMNMSRIEVEPSDGGNR